MSLIVVHLVIASTDGASMLIEQRFGELLKFPARVRGNGNPTSKQGSIISHVIYIIFDYTAIGLYIVC
jgi:hypothetical protein